MPEPLVIIGIDSLDPFLLKKFEKDLPNFSRLIYDSPTFLSKSVFPVDTIPAWMSIFTGLIPSNHGILYVYDIFDPELKKLKDLNISKTEGKKFWDFVDHSGYRSTIIFPNLIFPSQSLNGIMITKSPFERRKSWIETEIDIDVSPKKIQERYDIPDKIKNLWGGFPGEDKLLEWANLGEEILKEEVKIGLEIFQNEPSDLYFIYFSLLDIIQHRFWRFLDTEDPLYPGKNKFEDEIFRYYKIFDGIIGQYLSLKPNCRFMIVSDHGHKRRPINTININEYLRREGYLKTKNYRVFLMMKIRKTILTIIKKLHLETAIIKFVTKNTKLTKAGKTIYSSEGAIDLNNSSAFLSQFAGIKSYPVGGISINRNKISDSEYHIIRDDLINSLTKIKINSGENIFKFIKSREDFVKGTYCKELYPDIIFELDDDWGVGWDLHSEIFGIAHDHSVASGGHRKEGVFLVRNIAINQCRTNVKIVDICPTILDLFDIGLKINNFDGVSLLKSGN